MNESDKFLREFNIIETHFKKRMGKDYFIPFSIMLEELSKKDHFVRSNEDILKNLSDLRNTIVHRRGQEYLAIPTKAAIETITKIRQELTSPSLLFDQIKHEVTVKSSKTLLLEVLKEIKDTGYSQFPVYDNNQYIGLISNNAISRWIANNIEDDNTIIKDISTTTVMDVIRFNEKFDKVTFVSKGIYIKHFIDNHLINSKAETVWIITNSGKQNEPPLSIITNYDIEKILNYYS